VELTAVEMRPIDEPVENTAAKGTQKSFPSLISEETKITPKKVVKRLLALVAEGKILATYEFELKYPHCDRTVGRSDTKMKLLGTGKRPYCDNTFRSLESEIWVAFRLASIGERTSKLEGGLELSLINDWWTIPLAFKASSIVVNVEHMDDLQQAVG